MAKNAADVTRLVVDGRSDMEHGAAEDRRGERALASEERREPHAIVPVAAGNDGDSLCALQIVKAPRQADVMIDVAFVKLGVS